MTFGAVRVHSRWKTSFPDQTSSLASFSLSSEAGITFMAHQVCSQSENAL